MFDKSAIINIIWRKIWHRSFCSEKYDEVKFRVHIEIFSHGALTNIYSMPKIYARIRKHVVERICSRHFVRGHVNINLEHPVYAWTMHVHTAAECSQLSDERTAVGLS